MTNQEITSAVVKVENIKKRTFNQEQLASLYEDGKFFTSTDNSYEYSVSRMYVDNNVKMLITKRKTWNQDISYDFFINSWLRN